MKIPRDIGGDELAIVLCRRWGYGRVHQVGSHIILETGERLAEPTREALDF